MSNTNLAAQHVKELRRILKEMMGAGDATGATCVIGIASTILAACVNKHEEELKRTVKPCGKLGCDCHETRMLAIDQLKGLAEKLPRDILEMAR